MTSQRSKEKEKSEIIKDVLEVCVCARSRRGEYSRQKEQFEQRHGIV